MKAAKLGTENLKYYTAERAPRNLGRGLALGNH